MDVEDEAYHSGLALPSGTSGDFKGDDKQTEKSSTEKEDLGSALDPGTPPKERGIMNIGHSLQKKDSTKRPLDYSNPSQSSAMTPTTYLAGQLGSNLLLSQRVSAEGKLSDSPTSDYASGNFPSLPSGNFPSLPESDRGYGSLPSMASLEKPDQASVAGSGYGEKPPSMAGDTPVGEEMDVDHSNLPKAGDNAFSAAATRAKPGIEELAGKVSKRTSSESSSFGGSESSSLSPAPLSMLAPAVRSESPVSVPSVIAENVEITTEAVGSPSVQPPSSSASEYTQRQEGGKRSARLLESDLGPSTKNPRLSPEALGESGGC